jgi:UDP-N-acetylglucosamine 1-carboxyvinyltransferase
MHTNKPYYIINGGKPLHGAVRVGGAKNASFKLMIAASLAEPGKSSRLLNLAKIGDVEVTHETLTHLGVEVCECGERTLLITSQKFKSTIIPQLNGKKSRASTLFASVLLANEGEAIIPVPGGCVLGERPIDRHLDALKSLGTQIEVGENTIHLKAPKLIGAKYRFVKKTHTGTEAMILAAVKAKGRTIIENAGLEPEIDDLILFLNSMGAKINRKYQDTIVIDGVDKLEGAYHRVMPDRNEAVSYAVTALATQGDVIIEEAREKDLSVFLQKLEKIGARFEVKDYGIRFWYEKPLKATSLKTGPHPDFMTDWQPLWTILMTQAIGVSTVVEAVHNNRLQFTVQLNKMGANIALYNPEVKDPQSYYEFDNPDRNHHFHAAKIIGPTKLKAIDLEVPDLRAGATLTIAALIAQGKAKITNIEHIERGYENLDGRLRQLGADIKRVE